jgi:hypothetical protein
MAEPNYDAAPVTVRDDLAAAHRRAWAHIAGPGTWWDGAARVAIAAETRVVRQCRLCAARKAALSPYMVDGAHDALTDLPAPAIEVIHRVRSDAGRLTERWYQGVIASGLDEGAYVEIIAVLATTVAVDSFTHALGPAPHKLPAPRPGAPSRRQPRGAKKSLAWVATLAPEDVTAADGDLYAGLAAVNIHRALSLVPAEVIAFFDLDAVQYLPDSGLRDYGREYRAISHPQIELLAARVSAINGCVY